MLYNRLKYYLKSRDFLLFSTWMKQEATPGNGSFQVSMFWIAECDLTQVKSKSHLMEIITQSVAGFIEACKWFCKCFAT